MRAKMIRSALAGLLALLATGCAALPPAGAAFATPIPTAPPPPAVGLPAADFRLDGIDGQSVSLSDFRGKAVLLNFWATWCPPCKAEMPMFEQYALKYPDRLAVVGVDYKEDVATVRQFTTSLKITYPVLLDLDGSVAKLYLIHNYPVTLFIDPEGVIRAQHLGQLSEDLLKRYLETVGVQP